MTRKEHLTELHKNMDYYNRMAPFPPYDTDYVKKVKEVIESENDEDIDYDSLPVVACKYCKSLHITVEEGEIDVCNKCFTVGEIIEFENIHEYNKYLNKNEDR